VEWVLPGLAAALLLSFASVRRTWGSIVWLVVARNRSTSVDKVHRRALLLLALITIAVDQSTPESRRAWPTLVVRDVVPRSGDSNFEYSSS